MILLRRQDFLKQNGDIIEEIDNTVTTRLAVLAAVSFAFALRPLLGTPTVAALSCAAELPQPVLLGCGAGDSLLAAERWVKVVRAVDHDWLALHCVRSQQRRRWCSAVMNDVRNTWML